MRACQQRSDENNANQTQCAAGLNPRKRPLTAARLRISSASPVKIISIMLILLWGRRSKNLNSILTMLSFSKRSLSNAIHLILALFPLKINENIIAALYLSYFKTNSCKQAKVTHMIVSLHSIIRVGIFFFFYNVSSFVSIYSTCPIKYFISNHN